MARIDSEISVKESRLLFFLSNKILPIFCQSKAFWNILYSCIQKLCVMLSIVTEYIAREYQAVPSPVMSPVNGQIKCGGNIEGDL